MLLLVVSMTTEDGAIVEIELRLKGRAETDMGGGEMDWPKSVKSTKCK